ncbi:gag/pol protein [Cucumis melo var. makuwa]|uniref:Gag/pol protein n=1 Tax=Cucumis melo var. makuwa TaxID=1194695 RepID=A0A5A7VKZ3_CUCMM|nr:gag/pol protein [Cucumis melo var. makuwa]TYJ97480.1 gag/pol protein [Cucumis melo var. makuwa]
MFGQASWSLRHEAIKHTYTKQMKEGTFVREHVLGIMMHFNTAEVHGGPINETNESLNKIEFTLISLLNDLQHFHNLTMGKGKEVDANVDTTKKEFMRGSSSKTNFGPSQMKKKEKEKTPKNNK